VQNYLVYLAMYNGNNDDNGDSGVTFHSSAAVESMPRSEHAAPVSEGVDRVETPESMESLEPPQSMTENTERLSATTPAIHFAVQDEVIPTVGRHSHSDASNASFDTGKAVKAHSIDDADAVGQEHDSSEAREEMPRSVPASVAARPGFEASSGVPFKSVSKREKKDTILHKVLKMLGIKRGSEATSL